jgi:hypothetical protein
VSNLNENRRIFMRKNGFSPIKSLNLSRKSIYYNIFIIITTV